MPVLNAFNTGGNTAPLDRGCQAECSSGMQHGGMQHGRDGPVLSRSTREGGEEAGRGVHEQSHTLVLRVSPCQVLDQAVEESSRDVELLEP